MKTSLFCLLSCACLSTFLAAAQEPAGKQPEFKPADPSKLVGAMALLDEALRLDDFAVDRQLFINSEGRITGTQHQPTAPDRGNIGPGPIAHVVKSVTCIGKDISDAAEAASLTSAQTADIHFLIGTWRTEMLDAAKKLKSHVDASVALRKQQASLVPGASDYATRFNEMQDGIEATELEMSNAETELRQRADILDAAVSLFEPVFGT